MDNQSILFLAITLLTAVASRIPFLRFPLDDDFSIYTYVARFAGRGFRWKKDLWLLGKSLWPQLLLDRLYSGPESGPVRIRLVFMAFHGLTAGILFWAVYSITHNSWAALVGGVFYGFYGSSPDYTAGNYHQEQFYLAFLFAGLTLLWHYPGTAAVAGLLFGLAVIPKFTTGIHAGVMAGGVLIQQGAGPAAVFISMAALPVIVSLLIDVRLGAWDAEARKQYRTRWAVGIRLIRTKLMYFSIPREALGVACRTLPVWVLGLPSLSLPAVMEGGGWMIAFTVVTLGMIAVQHGFSRYHYYPLVSLLCLSTGLGTDYLMRLPGPWAPAVLTLLALTVLGNLVYMLPFYLLPTHPKNLARCEKFDQYLYLPRLAKILNRLMRMRGEEDRWIFVWGTFTQLYHLTGTPAADTFLHHGMGPWNSPLQEPWFDNVIGGLIKHQPIYIIKAFHDLKVERLESVTGLKYELIKVVLVRFPVYRLVSFTPPQRDPLSLPWEEKMKCLEFLTRYDPPPDILKTDCEGKHIPGINKLDIRRGRWQTAVRECRRLCRLNPYDTVGLYLLGKLYDRLGRVEESSQTLRQLLSVDPGYPHARMILAKQAIDRDRLEEAEEWIREDVKRFGGREETEFYRGRIFQTRGRHREAAECFGRIHASLPEWVDAGLYLAESLTALDRNAEAREVYQQALERVGDVFDAGYLRTRAAAGIAELDRERRPASQTLENFLQQFPGNENLAYALASALEREGDRDAARKLFAEYTARFSNPSLKAGAWFRLARLSPESGRQGMLRQCLKLAPEHSGARTLLAGLERETGPLTAGKDREN